MANDYISREAAIQTLRNLTFDLGDQTDIDDIIDDVLEFAISAVERLVPAADVRPVVRGEWLEPDDDYGYLECSVCEERSPNDERWNFCPNCGCAMENEK